MADRAGQQGAENEWVVWVILGGFGLLGLVWATAAAATRVTCGAWASPDSAGEAASFLWTGEPGRLGTVNGCAAEASTVWVSLGVIAVLVIALVIAGFVARARYKQSDRYFVREVRDRDGIAKASEIRSQQRLARKRGKIIRPSLKRPKVRDVGIEFGTSQGQNIWASMEDSVCLLGPPRSGKGLHLLISAILDAPGPVVSTSSRADNYAATHQLRAERNGPVALFDPQGLTGQATTIKWSPITGCEQPRVANQRASSLVKASGLGSSSENAVWQQPAIEILQSLLHAAALSGAGVAELYRWASAPEQAREAVQELKNSRDAKDWGTSLESVISGDAKMRDNKWFGVGAAVSGLAVPEYREAMTVERWDTAFDIDEFLDRSGTLYIVGNETGGSSVGAFLIALMDAITERAREKAAKSRDNRLDPPMALVLDEIANIAASWPGLAKLMSDGGGTGIMPLAVFQSLAQARNQWGQGAAETIFDNATVSILLGGAKNDSDLEKISKLIGPRRVIHRDKSVGKQGPSYSERGANQPVLELADLRRLPFGYGVVLRRTGRAIFLELRKWTDHREAKRVKESLAGFDGGLLTELTNGTDQVAADDGPVEVGSTEYHVQPSEGADVPVR